VKRDVKIKLHQYLLYQISVNIFMQRIDSNVHIKKRFFKEFTKSSINSLQLFALTKSFNENDTEISQRFAFFEEIRASQHIYHKSFHLIYSDYLMHVRYNYE
jgi:hypothetical protein